VLVAKKGGRKSAGGGSFYSHVAASVAAHCSQGRPRYFDFRERLLALEEGWQRAS
jgi:hypothetical protein